MDRFWNKVAKSDGCWLWTASRYPSGYGRFRLSSPTKAHRVAYELAFGPIPDGLCVLHRCDERRCVRPDHLFLGTHADNNADMCRKGRQARHESSGQAKLTENDVREIRILSDFYGFSQRRIASDFGVTQTQVGRILRQQLWKD